MFTSNQIGNKKVGCFVVGAQKAGTTTIHEVLSKEPKLSLPLIKETHFFCDEQRNKKGLVWYHDQFDENKDIWLEVDPDYTRDEKALKLISEYNPRSKIIFIYREPLARAYSQWKMNQRRNIEKLDFEAAVREEPFRFKKLENQLLEHFGYKKRSSYKEIIENILDNFDKENLLVINFDALVGDRKLETYEKIFNFIGIKSIQSLADLNVKANENNKPRLAFINKFLWNRKRKLTWTKWLLNESMKLRIAMWLDKVNRKKLDTAIDKVEVSKDVRDDFEVNFSKFKLLLKEKNIREIS